PPLPSVFDLSPTNPLPPSSYTLSLHDALPISAPPTAPAQTPPAPPTATAHPTPNAPANPPPTPTSTPSHQPPTPNDQSCRNPRVDRKSTRLNSSHVKISYAVFCLKKKTKQLAN